MTASPPRRELWLILGLALLVRVLAALPQTQPNYMDAAYYLVGGQRLAQGFGFNDPYVWNYRRSADWVAASQSSVLDAVAFDHGGAQPIDLGCKLSGGADSIRVVSGGFTSAGLSDRVACVWGAASRVDCGTADYLQPVLFAVLGRAGKFCAVRGVRRAGVVLGDRRIEVEVAGGWSLRRFGASLARRWRVVVSTAAVRSIRLHDPGGRRRIFVPHPSAFILILIGYGGVMLPWFLRNLNAIGAPLSVAGSQAIWLCNYDELFAYGKTFDLAHLLGCSNLIGARVNGVTSGAVHWLAEAGMIFLAPLIVIGLWHERRARLFRAALWYALLLFVAMTLVFTFAGDRGGLFHSTGALLPFFYAAAPSGLDGAIGWIAERRRSWNAATARRVFSVAIVIYAVALSFIIYRGRVIGPDWRDPIWNKSDQAYAAIGQWLHDRGELNSIVMVNNPPSGASRIRPGCRRSSCRMATRSICCARPINLASSGWCWILIGRSHWPRCTPHQIRNDG